MIPWREASEKILKKISEVIRGLDPSQVESMLGALLDVRAKGKKALIVGAGRSGLVGKAFAMRLMHLGLNVYVMGESITPAIGSGDLVIIISGSGSGALSTTAAIMAKKLEALVLALTSYPDSTLGKTADFLVIMPGRKVIAREEEYHSRQLLGEHASLAPMGTLFEDSCTIFLDSIIVELMSRLEVSEEAMKDRHSTIE
jgi:6-phospho-3-hexuloisomerase